MKLSILKKAPDFRYLDDEVIEVGKICRPDAEEARVLGVPSGTECRGHLVPRRLWAFGTTWEFLSERWIDVGIYGWTEYRAVGMPDWGMIEQFIMSHPGEFVNYYGFWHGMLVPEPYRSRLRAAGKFRTSPEPWPWEK